MMGIVDVAGRDAEASPHNLSKGYQPVCEVAPATALEGVSLPATNEFSYTTSSQFRPFNAIKASFPRK